MVSVTTANETGLVGGSATPIQRSATAVPPNFHHNEPTERGISSSSYADVPPPVPALPNWNVSNREARAASGSLGELGRGVGAMGMRSQLSGGGLSKALAAAVKASMGAKQGEEGQYDVFGAVRNIGSRSTLSNIELGMRTKYINDSIHKGSTRSRHSPSRFPNAMTSLPRRPSTVRSSSCRYRELWWSATT